MTFWKVYRLRERLGVATNNAAEYQGAILGLKFALEKGFKHIRVQGDSKLVCMQVSSIHDTLKTILNLGSSCCSTHLFFFFYGFLILVYVFLVLLCILKCKWTVLSHQLVFSEIQGTSVLLTPRVFYLIT